MKTYLIQRAYESLEQKQLGYRYDTAKTLGSIQASSRKVALNRAEKQYKLPQNLFVAFLQKEN